MRLVMRIGRSSMILASLLAALLLVGVTSSRASSVGAGAARATPAPQMVGPVSTNGLVISYSDNSSSLLKFRQDTALKHFVLSFADRSDIGVAYAVETLAAFQRSVSAHETRLGLSPRRVVSVLLEQTTNRALRSNYSGLRYTVFDAETHVLLQIHTVQMRALGKAAR